jgi:ribosome maturation factor RimP
MIAREYIIQVINEELPEGGALFLVDVKVSAGGEFEVFVDSDGMGEDGKPRRVTVEDCVLLTKAIEARFDRDVEDFALTVSSAGIGQPLKVLRQYQKLVGADVEVVLVGGTKFIAALEAVEAAESAKAGDGDGIENGNITLSYPEKQKIEGKKKPEIVTVTKIFPLAEVKTTKEYIDFK